MTAHNLLDQLKPRRQFVNGMWVYSDQDIAKLYRVSVTNLRRSVSRSKNRFPDDVICRLPQGYAFTEEGVLLVSTVLKTAQAIQVHIDVIRELHGYRHN